jgi:general secretion pathway protein J
MRAREARGFTLIELVLALTIVALMVTILFAGLRVGLRAWQRGDERAARLQHARSVTQLMEDALGGIAPFSGQPDDATVSPVLFFKGDSDKVSFVTVSPPMPFPVPMPFVAVTLSIDAGTSPGLAIREKALPNFDPFEAVAPAVVDPSITGAHFRYLRYGAGWEDSWDAVQERALPQAIEVTLAMTVDGRPQMSKPLLVPIRMNTP